MILFSFVARPQELVKPLDANPRKAMGDLFRLAPVDDL
jgi:hypothetical protein